VRAQLNLLQRALVGTALAVALAGTPRIASTAPNPTCTIVEGASIAGLRIGIPVTDAVAVTGPPTSQRAMDRQTQLGLRAPWSSMLIENQRVVRIETRSAACRTATGVGVGIAESVARAAYGSAMASITTSAGAAGDWVTFPFNGIALLMRRQRVEAVEVFTADDAPGQRPASRPTGVGPSTGSSPAGPTPASPAAPAPLPTRAAGWALRSLAGRVDETTLIVTGSVDNNARPQAVFAEVRAFSTRGQLVAQDDAPVDPSPLPVGRSGTFEVRIAIDDVVRRFTVIIRPAGSVVSSLVEGTGEIRDVQGFAPIVARKLSALVQTTAQPPTGASLVVAMSNGSSLVVSRVTVAVEITVTCRVAFPIARMVQEVRTGTATVVQLRPGEIGRAPVSLSDGICPEFTTWTPVTRIGEVRVGD
jgi:hypothetical protein